MNQSYSGGINELWSKSGLDTFELAHILVIKKTKENLKKKFLKSLLIKLILHHFLLLSLMKY